MPVSYPVKIPLKGRPSGNKKKLDALRAEVDIANRLEDYINKRMENKVEDQILYSEISTATGISQAIVKEYLQRLNYDSNGITVVRR